MNTEDLLEQYSCGPVKFSGRDDALYDRHLMFDQVAPITKASTREQFEAAARSVRDVLSQRWIKTEQTYQQRNAKRVYYLSMEYLMGRALANNITNLRLEPVLKHFVEELQKLDPLEIIEQEPDPGLGNGGLGRLAACFLDSMATYALPGMGSLTIGRWSAMAARPSTPFGFGRPARPTTSISPNSALEISLEHWPKPSLLKRSPVCCILTTRRSPEKACVFFRNTFS